MNSIRNHTVLVGILDELDVATSHRAFLLGIYVGMMVEFFEGTGNHPLNWPYENS